MSFIKACRKYKYFAATLTGEMPTAHKYDYDATAKDIDFCKKGWPEKQWCIFRVVFEKEDGEYTFKQVDKRVELYWQQFIIPQIMMDHLNERYPGRKIEVKA